MRIPPVFAYACSTVLGFGLVAPVSAESMKDVEIIPKAESAAPPSLSKAATIVTMDMEGNTRTIRDGTNGIICMPDIPGTPDDDPMCADEGWMKWTEAWLAHEEPPAGLVGMGYMYAGGSDASNVDPYATEPPEGEDWLYTGPHVMVVAVGADLSGYPGGEKPDTTKTYVMYPGTPYAHLMIPVH
jgi:hypothetical protein